MQSLSRDKLTAVCALLAVCAFGPLGCSKVDVAPSPNQPLTVVEPSAPPAKQTPAERIAEIERLLAAPLTGTTEDANRRATLRAERDALRSAYGYGYQSRSVATQTTQMQSYQTQQAEREHQQMIQQLKYDAERSRYTDERKVQAQREQWDKEDRQALRLQNGNYHPEAPPQNTYDVQIQRTHTNGTSVNYHPWQRTSGSPIPTRSP
jgi:hypothetical protein